MQPPEPSVWEATAAELRELRCARLGHLLTEETVRFAVVKALVAAGADPGTLRYESPHPELPRSRIDLVIGTPPETLIELKYPREPHEKNAAWTMIYGEVLKDFYRLASYPSDAARIFVYTESTRLRAYMTKAEAKYGFEIHRDQIRFRPDRAGGLPTTVTSVLGATLPTRVVTARRMTTVPIDATLSLTVYDVDPFDTGAAPAITAPVGDSSATTIQPGKPTAGRPRLRGVR